MRMFNGGTWQCKYCHFLFACGRQQDYLVKLLACVKNTRKVGQIESSFVVAFTSYAFLKQQIAVIEVWQLF